MKRFWFQFSLLIIVAGVFGLVAVASNWSVAFAQQPVVTPTSASVTTSGIFITVGSSTNTEPRINVRLGPSSIVYPIVGQLLYGSTAPALGKSPGGDWIQIEFSSAPSGKGWVYAPLVTVSSGSLQIVEPPPTPIPPATPTIDPTLAAQFNAAPTSTRLPTFTPPAPLTKLVFTDPASSSIKLPFPIASLIVFFVVVGSIGFVISLFRRR